MTLYRNKTPFPTFKVWDHQTSYQIGGSGIRYLRLLSRPIQNPSVIYCIHNLCSLSGIRPVRLSNRRVETPSTLGFSRFDVWCVTPRPDLELQEKGERILERPPDPWVLVGVQGPRVSSERDDRRLRSPLVRDPLGSRPIVS